MIKVQKSKFFNRIKKYSSSVYSFDQFGAESLNINDKEFK